MDRLLRTVALTGICCNLWSCAKIPPVDPSLAAGTATSGAPPVTATTSTAAPAAAGSAMPVAATTGNVHSPPAPTIAVAAAQVELHPFAASGGWPLGKPVAWIDPRGERRIIYFQRPDSGAELEGLSVKHAVLVDLLGDDVEKKVVAQQTYYRTGPSAAWVRSVAPPIGSTDGMTVFYDVETNRILAVKTGPLGPWPVTVDLAPLYEKAATAHPQESEQLSVDVTDWYYFGRFSTQLQLFRRNVAVGKSACSDRLLYQLALERTGAGYYRRWQILDLAANAPMQPWNSALGFACQAEFPPVDSPDAWPDWVDTADLPIVADFPPRLPPQSPTLGPPWADMGLPVADGEIKLSNASTLMVRYSGRTGAEVWSSLWLPNLRTREGWEEKPLGSTDTEGGGTDFWYRMANGKDLFVSYRDSEGAAWVTAFWP